MVDKPRFLPAHLIEIRSYDGKPRDELAEVYKVTWSQERRCWLYHVRLFVGERQVARFRNFFEDKLEAA